jgi:hypothetical protein
VMQRAAVADPCRPQGVRKRRSPRERYIHG